MNYLFLFLILVLQIYSKNSFKRGALLFDFGIGNLKTKVSDDASPERFTTLFFTYDVSPLYNSTNEERRNLGILKALTYKESTIQNIQSRASFEYGLFDYIGIGISYNQSSTKVRNVLPGDYLILASFGIPPESPKQTRPELSNYSTFIRRDLNAIISSVDLDLSFHLPYKNFDPYFRMSYGRLLDGVNNPNEARKLGLALGLRYFINKFTIHSEFYRGRILGDLGRTDFALEEGLRFGIGYSFFTK